jgi:hypothetical protein
VAGWSVADGKGVRVTPDAAGRLQQPGPVASGVLIATSRELLSVSAAGEVQSLFGGGGGPAARSGSIVRLGAWAGSPGVVARSCDGQPASKLSVDRTGSTLLRPVLRVNRGALAVNDTADGRVFDVDLQRSLDNWKDIQPKQQPNQTDKKSDVTPQNQDDAKPKAQPDRLGARPDRTTVLHVLDNDSDPMGGLLAIVAVTPPAGGRQGHRTRRPVGARLAGGCPVHRSSTRSPTARRPPTPRSPWSPVVPARTRLRKHGRSRRSAFVRWRRSAR